MNAKMLSTLLILNFILSVFVSSSVIYLHSVQANVSYNLNNLKDPIKPSNPTNVVVREVTNYQAPDSDHKNLSILEGVIYFTELQGKVLHLFINTSQIVSVVIRDFYNDKSFELSNDCGYEQGCYQDLGDQLRIVSSSAAFYYKIVAYFTPDVIQDTGFIVIFNSKTVDFSLESSQGELMSQTDYYSKIILPKGAGIVAYAPNGQDPGFVGVINLGEDHWALEWNFINKNLHPKFNPVQIAVTYKFSDIYLAYTNQLYNNQVTQQQQLQQTQRLNAIKSSFVFISLFSLVFSVFTTFLSYLFAKRKFQRDLQTAQELPKISADDIEECSAPHFTVRNLM